VFGVIKSSTDISRVFQEGRRYGRGSSAVIALKRDGQHGQSGRVAFVAGKKLGNAVWRNRAKRRMRAACMELGGPWDGYDVVFIAARNTTKDSYSKLISGYAKTLRQCGLR
jgi:ribonuclease P protein component